MYDEILISTDGSDASFAAVHQGVSIAEQFGSHVHFLHVVDVETEMSASGVGNMADELTETPDEMASDALDEGVVMSASSAEQVDWDRFFDRKLPRRATRGS